jgi:hypothetical protein
LSGPKISNAAALARGETPFWLIGFAGAAPTQRQAACPQLSSSNELARDDHYKFSDPFHRILM